MLQRNRYGFILLLITLLLAACSTSETPPEPSKASGAPTPSAEASSPTVAGKEASPSPAMSPDVEPTATPWPTLQVEAFERENGRTEMHVKTYDPLTGRITDKEYSEGDLISVSEYRVGCAFGQDVSPNYSKKISYRAGREEGRFEEREIYSSDGKLLELLELSDGLYYFRGEEHIYTDGLLTEYLVYGQEAYQPTFRQIWEYNENKQTVHTKYYNVQTGTVYFEIYYYENGRIHIEEGYTEGGNWYHNEYDEEGNLINSFSREESEGGEE